MHSILRRLFGYAKHKARTVASSGLVRVAWAVLQQGDADLIALARAFLYNPRWGWHAAAALGGEVQGFPAYWRCLPREAANVFGKVTVGMR